MNIKGAKIFVTGGAGFIGSHIVETLLDAGASVTVYDNFSFGSYENLKHLAPEVTIIEGDILDFEKLQKAMRGQDIVSHHAAQLEIFLSVEDPYKDLEVNTIGTLHVLRAAKAAGVNKVINASSACIYGQTNTKTAENYVPLPNWGYGVSKLAAERYCSIWSQYHDLPVVNIRYGITYGEREWFRRVLTIFIKHAVLGKPLVVFGDGGQVRDFIYVKDAVKLHNACIENEQANGESYNAGTGVATRIIDLAQTVATVTRKMFNRKQDIMHEETREGEFSKLVPDKKRNPAELKMMLLDPAKAWKDLQWMPTTSLADGIKKEMLWAKENLARWEKVHYTQCQA